MEKNALINERIQAEHRFGESLRQTIVPAPRKRLKQFFGRLTVSDLLPTINPTPVYESSYALGYATAKAGDDFSFHSLGIGDTVVSGVGVVQDQLGAMAGDALSTATKQTKLAESRIRALAKTLPRWLTWAILGATVVLDAVVANRAMSRALGQQETIIWLACFCIAALLAVTGFVLAVAAVRLLGKMALWFGLASAIVAVVALGFVTTGLRGSDRQVDIAEANVTSVYTETYATPEAKQKAVEKAKDELADARNENQDFLMYLYGALILLTVSAATLSQAYEAHQRDEVIDTRTVHRQQQRGEDIATGLSWVTGLRAWLPLSSSVHELGELGVAHYVDGYRAGLSPQRLDEFAMNPPKQATMKPAKWPVDFERRVDQLEGSLVQFESDLEMPLAH